MARYIPKRVQLRLWKLVRSTDSFEERFAPIGPRCALIGEGYLFRRDRAPLYELLRLRSAGERSRRSCADAPTDCSECSQCRRFTEVDGRRWLRAGVVERDADLHVERGSTGNVGGGRLTVAVDLDGPEPGVAGVVAQVGRHATFHDACRADVAMPAVCGRTGRRAGTLPRRLGHHEKGCN